MPILFLSISNSRHTCSIIHFLASLRLKLLRYVYAASLEKHTYPDDEGRGDSRFTPLKGLPIPLLARASYEFLDFHIKSLLLCARHDAA